MDVMRRPFVFLIFLFSLCLFPKVLAVVDKTKITDTDLKGKTLEEAVKEEVLYRYALRLGYGDTIAPILRVRSLNNIIRSLYNDIVLKKANVNEGEVYSLYRHMDKEFKVKVIKTRGFKTAYIALGRILRGEDFGKISEKYSDDIKLKNKKGDYGWIKWVYPPDRVIRKVYRMKKGQISFPFRDRGSWFIVKLEDVRIREVPSYESLRRELFTQIKRAKQRELATRHIEYLQKMLNIKFNKFGIQSFMDAAPVRPGMGKAGLPHFQPGQERVILATSVLGPFTVKDFMLMSVGAKRNPDYRNEKVVKQVITWQILYKALEIEAVNRGVTRKKNVEDYIYKTKKALILNLLRGKKLGTIDVNPDSLKNFFNRNTEKFKIPEKRHVYVILVNQKDKIMKIRNEVIKGADFSMLARKFSTHWSKNRGGDLGMITADNYPQISKIAFNLKKGEVSKPFQMSNGWAIVKVENVNPPTIQDFNTIRNSVEREYKMYLLKKWEDQIYNEYKDQFNVKILNKEE